MHSNTIMSQRLTLLPRHQFDQAVSDFGGDPYVKKFSTWNQPTTLMYAQASGKISLRDIQTALGTQVRKRFGLNHPPKTCPMHNLFVLDAESQVLLRHHLSAVKPDAFRKFWRSLFQISRRQDFFRKI